jgi:hypothetical protein
MEGQREGVAVSAHFMPAVLLQQPPKSCVVQLYGPPHHDRVPLPQLCAALQGGWMNRGCRVGGCWHLLLCVLMEMQGVMSGGGADGQLQGCGGGNTRSSTCKASSGASGSSVATAAVLLHCWPSRWCPQAPRPACCLTSTSVKTHVTRTSLADSRPFPLASSMEGIPGNLLRLSFMAAVCF